MVKFMVDNSNFFQISRLKYTFELIAVYDSKYHMADCPYFNIYVKHDKSMTIRKARYHLPERWCLTSTSLPETGDMLPKPGGESPSF